MLQLLHIVLTIAFIRDVRFKIEKIQKFVCKLNENKSLHFHMKNSNAMQLSAFIAMVLIKFGANLIQRKMEDSWQIKRRKQNVFQYRATWRRF